MLHRLRSPLFRRRPALILLACWSAFVWTQEPGRELLELELRVHLVRSSASPGQATTLKPEDVHRALAEVNQIWRRAGIAWRVDSIVEDRIGAVQDRGQLVSALSRTQLTDSFWHVFIVRDMGGVPGFYAADVPAVIQAEVDPFGGVGLNGVMTRILAHELGHSLGLQHMPCSAAGNLMAANCPSADRFRLLPFQIEQARAIARLQRPARGSLVTPVELLLRHADSLELDTEQEKAMIAILRDVVGETEPLIARGMAIVSTGRAEMASNTVDRAASLERRRELATLQSRLRNTLQRSLAAAAELLDEQQRSAARQLLEAQGNARGAGDDSP